MNEARSAESVRPSRRGFLGAGAVASLAGGAMVHASASAAEPPRELRLAVVGCGGRGTGAISDSLSINDGVTLVAVADLYEAKCAGLVKAMSKAHPDKVAVDASSMHAGLDGYRRVLDDPRVDVVLLATAPGFRPATVRAAVEAGKHVFAEKPACVDAIGYRTCLEAHDLAVARGTAIVTGTQYRRQVNYVGAIERIRAGAIGDVVAVTTRYCSGGIWYRPRREDMSDTEYQLNNWMHFIWLGGDQIVEQAVHNLDTVNWLMGSNPHSAYASGGRFTRPADSEMWDSVSVDYEYPGNRCVSFMCRQIPGTAGENRTTVYGTTGICHIGAMSSGSRIEDRQGTTTWEMAGSIADAYKQEHKDLIDSVRSGRPIVELRQTADSSMVAILGRVAAYTGQRVTWDFMTRESQLDLFPRDLSWSGALPSGGHAVPGRTKLI